MSNFRVSAFRTRSTAFGTSIRPRQRIELSEKYRVFTPCHLQPPALFGPIQQPFPFIRISNSSIPLLWGNLDCPLQINDFHSFRRPFLDRLRGLMPTPSPPNVAHAPRPLAGFSVPHDPIESLLPPPGLGHPNRCRRSTPPSPAWFPPCPQPNPEHFRVRQPRSPLRSNLRHHPDGLAQLPHLIHLRARWNRTRWPDRPLQVQSVKAKSPVANSGRGHIFTSSTCD